MAIRSDRWWERAERAIVVLGAGGHAAEVCSYALDIERTQGGVFLLGCLDDGKPVGRAGPVDVIGPIDQLADLAMRSRLYCITAVGDNTLRQRFVDLTVPQAKAVSLSLPDPDLRYDEASGHWQIGPIDWAEFYAVISGNGPCNRERLAARRRAHEEGEWVRRAATAHAAKRRSSATDAA